MDGSGCECVYVCISVFMSVSETVCMSKICVFIYAWVCVYVYVRVCE